MKTFFSLMLAEQFFLLFVENLFSPRLSVDYELWRAIFAVLWTARIYNELGSAKMLLCEMLRFSLIVPISNFDLSHDTILHFNYMHGMYRTLRELFENDTQT